MPRPIRLVPWLTQEKNGYYYVNWYDKAKRRSDALTLGTKDAGEAAARYAAFLVNKGQFLEGQNGPQLTVRQALDHYWEEHVRSKVITTDRRLNCIEHLKAWFGDAPVVSITDTMCEEYEAARRIGPAGWVGKVKRGTGKATTGTIRQELGALEAAINHAMKKRRVGPTATPPTTIPVIVRPKEDVARKHPFLTKEELALLWRYAEPDLSDFVTVAYYTGGRKTSIEIMHPSQVDLEAGTINLTHPDETQLQLQSKKRRPEIPIFDIELRSVLQRLLLKNGDTPFLLGGVVGDDGVLRAPKFYERFKALALKVGISAKNAHPHILRHSRATHLLQEGATLFDTSKLLGDLTTTVEKIYGHHNSKTLGQSLQALKKPELRLVK